MKGPDVKVLPFGSLLRQVWLDCGESPMTCKFDKMVRRLDGYGAQWAIDNLSTVVGWMVEHARNRGMEYDEQVLGGLVKRLAVRVLNDDSGRMAAAVGGGAESLSRGKVPETAAREGGDQVASRSGASEVDEGASRNADRGGSTPVVEGSEKRGAVQS